MTHTTWHGLEDVPASPTYALEAEDGLLACVHNPQLGLSTVLVQSGDFVVAATASPNAVAFSDLSLREYPYTFLVGRACGEEQGVYQFPVDQFASSLYRQTYEHLKRVGILQLVSTPCTLETCRWVVPRSLRVIQGPPAC